MRSTIEFLLLDLIDSILRLFKMYDDESYICIYIQIDF